MRGKDWRRFMQNGEGGLACCYAYGLLFSFVK